MKYISLEVLKHYQEYFNSQEDRKYTYRIVRCAVVTQDKETAINYMSNKNVKIVRTSKYMIEWELDNGERWLWLNWNDSARGYRFYKVAIDTSIDEEVFKCIILPCCANYCCSFEIIGEKMLKKYEVEEIIRGALFELDGIMADCPNEDGTYDWYFADVQEESGDLVLIFDTYRQNKKICTDKYRIKVEYM